MRDRVESLELTSDDELWFIGDLTDRGPEGAACVKWVRTLCEGENVECILGNHDALIWAVSRYGTRPYREGGSRSFEELWLHNGGNPSDLEDLSEDDLDWLINRPAAAISHNTLLVHADSRHYLQLGSTPDQICARVRALIQDERIELAAAVFDALTGRGAFKDSASEFLSTYDVGHVVHGHTPIPLMTGLDAKWVDHAYTYGDATNVDGGMYMGGPGFIHRVEQQIRPESTANAT